MMKSKLPKSWNDVTLRHLIEIENIRNDKSIDGEPYAEITRSLLMLSLFTGVSYEEYESMPISSLKKEIKSIEFLNELPNGEPVKKFKCGGYSWKVIFDVNEFTAQEFVNHYELTKDPTKVMQNADKLLAIYCKPYKFGFAKKLEQNKICEILKDAPIKVIYPLTLFFCNLIMILSEDLKVYLNNADKIMAKKLREINHELQEVV